MEPISRFIHEGLTAGHSKESLADALSQAGWPSDEIENELQRYADVSFPIPVPRPRPSGSAKEAFLYLLTFFALYTWVFSLGALLYAFVDMAFPDPVHDPSWTSAADDGLRWLVASIVVAFPIYYMLTRSHLRAYKLDPSRRQSAVRRWLTYLTLFVASTVFIGYLISLIGSVLGGELAARFLLKAGVALSLAAGVFLFYFAEMRAAEEEPRR